MSEKSDIAIRTMRNAFREAAATHDMLAEDGNLHNRIYAATRAVIHSLRSGGRVLFCGNGGSAADAQHLAAELSGRFYRDRDPLDAEALHVNTSYLTAVANDYGYDCVFERLVIAKGRRGDTLVGLSTSGNSANIVKAFVAARSIGLTTVAFTGHEGGDLSQWADHLLAVPATITTRIQELHILIGHTMCQVVEEALFPVVHGLSAAKGDTPL